MNREQQIDKLNDTIDTKDKEIRELKSQLKKLQLHLEEAKYDSNENFSNTYTLKEFIQDYKDTREGIIQTNLKNDETTNKKNSQNAVDSDEDYKNKIEIIDKDGLKLKDQNICSKYLNLKQEFDESKKVFEKERLIWTEEKEKVLRYQKQLQVNYIQMYRRTRALEAEVDSLKLEREFDSNSLRRRSHKKETKSS